MKQLAKSLSLLRGVVVCAVAPTLAACVGNIELGPDAIKGKTVDATVDLRETQAAYIGSGNARTGT